MSFRKLSILAVITMTLLSVAAHSDPVDYRIMLRTISGIETPYNQPNKIGQAGERAEFQFTAEVWKHYSNVPFKSIGSRKNRQEVQRVALRHLLNIESTLEKRHVAVTPYNIAIAWNGGLYRSEYLPRHRDYAQRASNLYERYRSESK